VAISAVVLAPPATRPVSCGDETAKLRLPGACFSGLIVMLSGPLRALFLKPARLMAREPGSLARQDFRALARTRTSMARGKIMCNGPGFRIGRPFMPAAKGMRRFASSRSHLWQPVAILEEVSMTGSACAEIAAMMP